MGKCKSLILICMLLVGCQLIKRPARDESDGMLFRPPTINPDIQYTDQAATFLNPTQNTDIAISDLSQQPDCTDNLLYIADKTIPDGTLVSPGIILDKQWEVENQGDCNWNSNYRLKLIAGQQLSAPPEQALYPARSGSRAIIRILFTAPQEAGNYRSAWQAYSPSGEPFGDPIFIDFIVEEPTPLP